MWLLYDIRYMDMIVVWHPVYRCCYWWHLVYECDYWWHSVYRCDCCVTSIIWMWLLCDIWCMNVVVVWHSVYECDYCVTFGIWIWLLMTSGIWIWLLCDIQYMNVVVVWHLVYGYDCWVTSDIWMRLLMLFSIWMWLLCDIWYMDVIVICFIKYEHKVINWILPWAIGDVRVLCVHMYVRRTIINCKQIELGKIYALRDVIVTVSYRKARMCCELDISCIRTC